MSRELASVQTQIEQFSTTRANLRRHFEVDRYYIAHAAIDALAKDGKMTAKDAARAIKLYKLDQEKPNPLGV